MDSLTAQSTGQIDEGQQFFLRLLKSSNESVERMLKQPQQPRGRSVGRGANVAALAAAYCAPESAYYKSESLIPLMESSSRVFVDAQHPDGTLDAGNLSSPPDTGFVVEGLAATLAVFAATGRSAPAANQGDSEQIPSGCRRVLVTGGVHTPNHRWVIAPLSRESIRCSRPPST